MVTEFNEWEEFLLEGGRGGGKSWAVAKLIVYLCCVKKVRVGCGREVQNTLEDSVYQLLVDVITKHGLLADFNITQGRIKHKYTGSSIRFFGLQEHGSVNTKGLEGLDIFWGEEAQSISANTLEVLLPTIRKEKSRCIFTMNRHIVKDPVYQEMINTPTCLHIKINFDENEFCPEKLKRKAATCLINNPEDYPHVWQGLPRLNTVEHLFNFEKLAKLDKLEPFGELYKKQVCLSVDLAGGGTDLCVTTVLERKSTVHWQLVDQICWSNPDTDESVGKCISLFGDIQPDVFVVDAGGLGYPMFVTIAKVIPSVIGFDGGKTDFKPPTAHNNRAGGYFAMKEFIDAEWLCCKATQTVNELESIKKVHRPSGEVHIMSKQEMRAKGFKSPDRADSLMMAIWAVKYRLGKQQVGAQPEGMRLKRVNVIYRGKR